LCGSADLARRKNYLAESEVMNMTKENRELWKAFMEWLEIANETNERLRVVRQELDKLRTLSKQDREF